MLGSLSRFWLLGIFSLIAMLSVDSHAAMAQSFEGQSSDYGFAFTARGGTSWCKEVVEIDLGIADRSKFDRDPYGLEKRLHRLLKWTQRQCSNFRRLDVRAWQNQKLIYNVEYAKATQWTFIRKRLDINIPQCPPRTIGDQCAALVAGFAFFETITDDQFFLNMELTSYLTEIARNISWVDGNVVGQMNSFDLTQFPEQPASIGGALIASLTQQCQREGGRVEQQQRVPAKPNTFYFGFNCLGGAEPTAHNLIVVKFSDFGWIFSIGSVNGDTAGSKAWADKLYSRL